MSLYPMHFRFYLQSRPISALTCFVPAFVDAVLLPFRGKIIYDSILVSHSISFGAGIRKAFNAEFQEIKKRTGIIMSLEQSWLRADLRRFWDSASISEFKQQYSVQNYCAKWARTAWHSIVTWPYANDIATHFASCMNAIPICRTFASPKACWDFATRYGWQQETE